MTKNIHASCVLLKGAGKAFGVSSLGVLIIGKSGSGKSDLCLRLIAAGGKLVADDRTELFVKAGKLHARAPKTIAGLIEIRAVGIMELPFAASARIGLVVDLDGKPERLPVHKRFTPPKALGLPGIEAPLAININAFEASAPAKIAAAMAAFSQGLFRDQVKPR